MRLPADAPFETIVGALDALPIATAIASPSGEITFANARLREITGLSRRRSTRTGALLTAVHEDDRPRIAQALLHFHRPQPLEAEFRIWCRGAEGEEAEARWQFGRATPVLDSHGEIEYWLCTAVDIHELKSAQEEVVKRRHFVELLGAASPDLLYVYDVETQRNVYCNPASLPILGYTPEEIQEMGSSLLPTIVHPEDWPERRDRMIAGEAGGASEVVEDEFRCCRPDGSVVWLNNRSLAVEQNTEGAIKAYLGIARDVTAQKASEFEAREHTRILENALERIARIEPDDTISYANTAFAELFGQSPESLLGRTCEGLLAPGECLRIAELEPRAVQLGKVNAEVEGLRANGALFQADATLVPRDGGGVYLFLRDETERATFQAQLESQLLAISEMRLELEARTTELEWANAILAREATTDGLTGLANHRHFQERLADLDDAHTPYALLLLDVDHFKLYNDGFGHPEGDTVLRRVAEVLTNLTGDGEFAARYGGEEFAMVLPGIDLEGAEMRGAMILRQLEQSPWPLRPVTASVGCAASAVEGEVRHRRVVIDAADRALYVSKRNGRNRVTAAA